jgi:DNA-directed RNA polymerase subunit RPC12/RpoP
MKEKFLTTWPGEGRRARPPRYGQGYLTRTFGDFRCIACGQYVSADAFLSGVHHRNHCPYCLWSRHLDLFQAGDRLAACKARMQPLGLALKRAAKKYGSPAQGELMLVHRCTQCGRVSINRIAADDSDCSVLEVFQFSLELDGYTRAQIAGDGIQMLGPGDLELVRARLFGWAARQ